MIDFLTFIRSYGFVDVFPVRKPQPGLGELEMYEKLSLSLELIFIDWSNDIGPVRAKREQIFKVSLVATGTNIRFVFRSYHP